MLASGWDTNKEVVSSSIIITVDASDTGHKAYNGAWGLAAWSQLVCSDCYAAPDRMAEGAPHTKCPGRQCRIMSRRPRMKFARARPPKCMARRTAVGMAMMAP